MPSSCSSHDKPHDITITKIGRKYAYFGNRDTKIDLATMQVERDYRAIERLECSEKFNALNFEVVDYLTKDFAEPNFRLCFKINQLQNGKPQAYYEMTKDGFTLLAMGFTGKKALFGVSFLF